MISSDKNLLEKFLEARDICFVEIQASKLYCFQYTTRKNEKHQYYYQIRSLNTCYFLCSFVYHVIQMRRICRARECSTGWRRLIGSPKLQIIFHKRAARYRSLLRKMTYKDKGSYESSPPYTTRVFERVCLPCSTCCFVEIR